ncbi:MAG: DUF4160 domain-containing protein [Pyrinomonadaceae bacterium]
MPTILRQDGFEFRIRLNDHDPPHVHVFLRDGEAKIEISKAEVMQVWNMRSGDVHRAELIVKANKKHFIDAWRSIHG